jgi:hypothetical protein
VGGGGNNTNENAPMLFSVGPEHGLKACRDPRYRG